MDFSYPWLMMFHVTSLILVLEILTLMLKWAEIAKQMAKENWQNIHSSDTRASLFCEEHFLNQRL